MKSYDVCECGAPLRLMERPTPKPTGTEVLLKVIAAGVCHSDLHIWEGHYDLGGGKLLKLADRGVKLPLTMGHENVGEVVAVGPGARDEAGKLIPIDLKPGDRVLFGKWSGTEVKIDGEELLIMKESDVMGVLEGAKASKKVA